MRLTLDTIVLGVPRVEDARGFYASAFSLPTPSDGAALDLHGAGHLAVQQIDALAAVVGATPATSGFRGFVVGAILEQPGAVRDRLDAASEHGAEIVKPAKKQLFGEFTAAYRAPDGAVWKLAAASNKDAGTVPSTPKPTETAIYLGVASPKAAKSFYESLGMGVDRDYGDKFVDFTVTDGVSRLGLLPRKGIAKDVGGDSQGDGFAAVVLTHTAPSSETVDALLTAAAAAGGRIVSEAIRTDGGAYAGYFADLDGFHWKVTTGR
ncbi:VOC family protein [Occultella gossypii]|uniref:VOC domain-containing protein n=1 Tax=Occultella gossypii TaxID=2800820 RepID=A0ABS7SG64_9MICO|nr:VOC family protein [Occultella gossypii]MBZ2199336.1 hypothetical protein [Occultella gossypii]